MTAAQRKKRWAGEDRELRALLVESEKLTAELHRMTATLAGVAEALAGTRLAVDDAAPE